MTTLMVVDGGRGETRSQAAARRLRSELAGKRISVSEAARRAGMNQQTLSRRMTGEVEFKVDELDSLCQATGVSFTYVIAGIKETPAGPNGPDGGSDVRPKGFEPLTSWSVTGSALASNVSSLRPRTVSSPRPERIAA
ncbi:helix-turn-helix domain-containing protein [Rhodococcus hoagii]|nr:helix-turn-helix domain-containing protein [Prescottella equi]NKW12979.1 helix-turn-helix domain-containing protein [Prescottella equi]